jgi:hypothetical protein
MSWPVGVVKHDYGEYTCTDNGRIKGKVRRRLSYHAAVSACFVSSLTRHLCFRHVSIIHLPPCSRQLWNSPMTASQNMAWGATRASRAFLVLCSNGCLLWACTLALGNDRGSYTIVEARMQGMAVRRLHRMVSNTGHAAYDAACRRQRE